MTEIPYSSSGYEAIMELKPWFKVKRIDEIAVVWAYLGPAG
jgi:hypothetical protein